VAYKKLLRRLTLTKSSAARHGGPNYHLDFHFDSVSRAPLLSRNIFFLEKISICQLLPYLPLLNHKKMNSGFFLTVPFLNRATNKTFGRKSENLDFLFDKKRVYIYYVFI